MAFGRLIVAALAACCMVSMAAAQSIWTGNGDGTTWSSAANWQSGVPGPGDNAVINSGTPIVAAAASVGGLTVTGGTLTLNDTLTVNGVAHFGSINTIVGPASIVISSTGSVMVAAGTSRQVDVSLVNAGMMELFNGSVLIVNGTFTQQDSGSIRAHIDGVALSQIGRVASAGPANVSGAVRAVYDNGFAPNDCTLTYTILTSQHLTPGAGLNLVAPVTAPISATIHVRPSSLRLDPHNPADVAGLGGSLGSDGQVTADDLIVYLDRYFANDLAVADIASLGGSAGRDGLLTPDDLILFLGALLSGTCSGV